MEPPGPEWDLHTDELFAHALTKEIAETTAVNPYLLAIHERPAKAVVQKAVALLGNRDRDQRRLGARVLGELGSPQPGSDERPFQAQVVKALIGALDNEHDPTVLTGLISAVAFRNAPEALTRIVVLTDHADDDVRFSVAAALPSLINITDPEPSAVQALKSLAADSTADTR